MNWNAAGRGLLALVLGGLCGLIANWAGLPLPWMLGPMIGVTSAALIGAPLRGPEGLRPYVIPVIGVLLGSGFTPEAFMAVSKWAVTLLLLVPFLIVAALASYTFYRKVGRFDPITAFFCAMPGGLNDMMIMGAQAGGDETRIALAHASRVLLVVLFVVLFFGFFMGVTTGDKARNWVELSALAPLDWAVLGTCAVLGVILGKWVGLPASPIFGPMILSGAAHLTELVTVAPPSVVVIVAQIVVGTVIGCRFMGRAPRDVGYEILLGVGASLSMITVAVAFAFLTAYLTGTDLSQAFLAYSPGGLTEMSLLALAMGQDVTYVSLSHIIRITLVIAAARPALQLVRRWF